MTGIPPHAHGTGWAGVARYAAREKIRSRMTRRQGLIVVLEAEQAADAALLADLADAPRPRSTDNGEDDHVRNWEEKP